jgi:hypothetical protein
MTRKTGSLVALAIVASLLTGAQVPAQAQQIVAACPPGEQLVPPGTDGAGNPVAAYCAATPIQGTYDPYTGPYALDPSANQTDGPGQFIPQSR